MTKPNSVTPSHTDPFSRKYKILSKIGEGSYSEVLKCKNRESGSVLACKRLKHCYRSWNQVNDIPEIVTLRKLARHPNILQMVEIHFDPTVGRVSLVFELMDMNLYELIKDRKRLLPEPRVRVMMFQLMRALRHLHKHGIFHRDVKPENILLKNDLLKLGDLGSVRGLYSRPPYTEYISTRWYRSPECLLTCGYYSFKMDVWAAGCVFYEILTLRPLFPGSSELDQINRVHNVLGPPPQKILQKFQTHAGIERDYSRHTSKQARLDTIKKVLGELKNSESRNFDWYFAGKESKGVDTLLPTHVTTEAKDLLKHLLQYDPDSRPSSHRALQHAYFKDLREQAQRAAREKIPSVTGPIVTIVGDEGGLEVVADDNANPVDLATLGDGKLKIKPPPRHASEIKELKESMSASTRKSTFYNESNSKIPVPPFKATVLKEAGEIFSHDSVSIQGQDDSEKKPSSNLTEPKRVEERAKLVARTLANLQKFGGDSSISSLPFQKIYSLGDDDDGDGPNNSADLSTSLLEENKRKIHHNNNNNNNNNNHSIPNPIPSSRRRGSSKMKLEVERKKSMMLISNDNSPPSNRGFPLDFIDKTSLTQDAITRINENRRIAHMQPIGNLEFNLKKPSNTNTTVSSNNNSHRSNSQLTPPSKDKDRHYDYAQSPGPDLKQKFRPTRSPSLPTNPNEFSPRTFQQRKPMKLDHNQVITNFQGSPSPSPAFNSDSSGGGGGGGGNALDINHANSKYRSGNNNSSTNKQVKELLASFPTKRKPIPGQVSKVASADKGKNDPPPGPGLIPASDDRLSYRSLGDMKKTNSKNQLVKNIGALRKKYEAETKAIYSNPHHMVGRILSSGKNDGGKTFNLDKKNLNPKKSLENTKNSTHTNNNNSHSHELPPIKQDTKLIRHLRESPYIAPDRVSRDKDQGGHKHSNRHSALYNDSRHQNQTQRYFEDNNNSNETRNALIDLKDIGPTFNRREPNHNRNEKNPNVVVNEPQNHKYSDHYEKDRDRIVHRIDLHKVPEILERHNNINNRDRDKDINYGSKPVSDRILKERDDYNLTYSSNRLSQRKTQNPNPNLDQSTANSNPLQQQAQMDQSFMDSTASLSPTNIRRVIENRRKAELMTTDTEADGDNQNQKYRKIESSRRKRRSRYSTGSSNQNTSRAAHDNDQLPMSMSTSTNKNQNPSDYAPRNNKQQQQQLILQPAPSLDTSQNYNPTSRISAFVAANASTKYANPPATNKQVREILAEMRKRRDVLEEKVIKDTNYHTWAKSPRVEDNIIKSKFSESVIKRSIDNSIPRRDEVGESYYVNNNKYSHNNNTTSSLNPKYQPVAPRQVKHGHVTSIAEFKHADQQQQQQQKQLYSKRRSEDLENNKIKLGHQTPGLVKYLDSESRIKGLGKTTTMDTSKNNHQSQTGAGSKIFPRNRYATNLHNK